MRRGKDPVIVERFVFPPVALRAIAHQTGDAPTLATARAWINKTIDATLDQIIAEYYDRDTPAARHTVCRHCALDIEGIAPYLVGEWRDRGNNTHCPRPEGESAQLHEPVKD